MADYILFLATIYVCICAASLCLQFDARKRRIEFDDIQCVLKTERETWAWNQEMLGNEIKYLRKQLEKANSLKDDSKT